MLHAYDATNLATELYNSNQAANQRDTGAAPVNFAVPTVANGKVFVGGRATVDVYALLAGSPQRLAAPTFTPTPSSYAGTQSSRSTPVPERAIYYTLDGTLPTLASARYSGPLNVSATTTIKAMAVQSGFLTSAVATGTYSITPGGQIAYVQGAYATPQSPQSSVAVKYASAQQQGDLNVVVVGWNDSTATVKSVIDSSGNTYTRAVGPTVMSGVASQAIYYAANIVAAAANANTVTVAFNGAAIYADIRIVEYGGIATTTPLDVAAAGSGAGTEREQHAVTTTSASDLIVGADLTLRHTLASSGFTSRMITVPDGDIVEDKFVTTTGSYTATAPIAPSGRGSCSSRRSRPRRRRAPPTPTAPSGLTATAAGATGINLSWSAASETGGSIAQYLIERCHGRRLQQLRADRDLDDHVLREHRAQWLDQLQLSRARQGCRGQHRAPTRTPPAPRRRAAVPGAPTNLAAVAAGGTQVNLSWGAATETGGTVSSYLIERCQGVRLQQLHADRHHDHADL